MASPETSLALTTSKSVLAFPTVSRKPDHGDHRLRSTIQRLGKTSNPTAVGGRPTISIVQHPVLAAALVAFGP